VLVGVGADDLDLERRDRHARRDRPPSLSRRRDGVYAVGDHAAAQPQIVGRDRVGDAVTGVVHRPIACARVAQRLLDGIDAHVHGAGLARQLARDRRLADAGQAAKDDQHRGAQWCIAGLAHVPAKWTPVRRQEHAPIKESTCSLPA